MLTKLTSAGFALLILLGASSPGAVVTDFATFGSQDIGIPSFTLELDKFNPALGALTSVTLTLEATSYCNCFGFDNESSSSGSVTLEIGALVTAKTAFSLATTIEAKATRTESGSVKKDQKNDGNGDFEGNDSFWVSGGGSGASSTIETAPSVIAQYLAGPSSNTFLVTIANSLFSKATTSGLFGPTSANAGSFYGKVTVAYSYLLVPVPEAGTAFWGMCLGVFAATRRMRTRRS